MLYLLVYLVSHRRRLAADVVAHNRRRHGHDLGLVAWQQTNSIHN